MNFGKYVMTEPVGCKNSLHYFSFRMVIVVGMGLGVYRGGVVIYQGGAPIVYMVHLTSP